MEAADTLTPAAPFSPCVPGGAGITLFTLGADYSAEVCGLSVGIGQHQLAVRIDLRIRNTDPVLSVGAGDLVKIDGLSVRKCQQQLSFFVDFRINDADTGGTVGAILAIGTICAVLAVCSCSADSSAYIQTAARRREAKSALPAC